MLFRRSDHSTDIVLVALLVVALALLLTVGILWIGRKKEPPPTEQAETFKLEGKLWLALGDSITENGYWQPFVREAMPELGYLDEGVGGSAVAGFARHAFWQEERLARIMNANPDLISILGGTNDFFSGHPLGEEEQLRRPPETKDVDTFLGAYSYLIERLLKWKPDLKIVIISTPPAYSCVDGSDPSGSGLRVADYVEAERGLAAYYKLVYVDIYHEIPFSAADFYDFFPDGIHPNSAYAEQMADCLLRALRKLES